MDALILRINYKPLLMIRLFHPCMKKSFGETIYLDFFSCEDRFLKMKDITIVFYFGCFIIIIIIYLFTSFYNYNIYNNI